MLRNYKIWLCTSIVLLIALIATYRTLDTTKSALQALKKTKIDTSTTDNKTTLTSEIQASQKVSESGHWACLRRSGGQPDRPYSVRLRARLL